MLLVAGAGCPALSPFPHRRREAQARREAPAGGGQEDGPVALVGGPGQLERRLVQRDLADGTLSEIQAQELIDDFDQSQFVDPELADGTEGDTPEKLVEEIAAKGVGALKSRGYVTAAEAQRLAADVADSFRPRHRPPF